MPVGRPPATAVERAIMQTEQNLNQLYEAQVFEQDHKDVMMVKVDEVPALEVSYELRKPGGEVVPSDYIPVDELERERAHAGPIEEIEYAGKTMKPSELVAKMAEQGLEPVDPSDLTRGFKKPEEVLS